MRAVICYFSGSGNTRLALQYLIKRVPHISCTLLDITKDASPDIDKCDIVGFATFADFLGPSKLMADFIRSLPPQNRKPAFAFTTFGNFNGGSLRILAGLAASKGFAVFAGHALHMPENYPPMIKAGFANAQAPDPGELEAFNRFIARLREQTADPDALQSALKTKFKPSLLERLMPPAPRSLDRLIMGKKSLDTERCTGCGICARGCPYGAIAIPAGIPTFNRKKCYGCWACYNHCPVQAIYTKKFSGVGQYPEPIPQVKEKLQG